MSKEATINVAKVETKPTSRGSVFKIYDHAGTEYATFDAGIGNIAMGFNGKSAAITFTERTKEKDGHTYTDRFLDSIQAADPAAPIASRTPDGAADWDIIGLRKTRCALWGAYLSSPLAVTIAARNADLDVNAVYNAGRMLVEYAEFDIFARPSLNPGEDPTVPF